MIFKSILFIFFVIQFLLQTSVHGWLFGLPKICLCKCGLVKNPNYPSRFPWLAIINTGSELIEGSLISDQHILTAASPLYGVPLTNVTVTLGSYDRCRGESGINTSISAININPSYSPTTLTANLALVKLRYPVSFNDFILPICLPFYGLQENGKIGWTAGWQLNSENATCVSNVATVPLLTSRFCESRNTDGNLLTYDKGCFEPLRSTLCNMEAGAPIMWRWADYFSYRLVGVLSSPVLCDENITPVYIRVIEYLNWIYDHISSDCTCL